MHHAELSWVNTTLYIQIWLWIRSVGWDSGGKNHRIVNPEKKRHEMQIRHGLCRTNCWPFIRGSCVCSLQPQIMWSYMRLHKEITETHYTASIQLRQGGIKTSFRFSVSVVISVHSFFLQKHHLLSVGVSRGETLAIYCCSGIKESELTEHKAWWEMAGIRERKPWTTWISESRKNTSSD